jgi:hypothetical protein
VTILAVLYGWTEPEEESGVLTRRAVGVSAIFELSNEVEGFGEVISIGIEEPTWISVGGTVTVMETFELLKLIRSPAPIRQQQRTLESVEGFRRRAEDISGVRKT